jgi:hypothetical protein
MQRPASGRMEKFCLVWGAIALLSWRSSNPIGDAEKKWPDISNRHGPAWQKIMEKEK